MKQIHTSMNQVNLQINQSFTARARPCDSFAILLFSNLGVGPTSCERPKGFAGLSLNAGKVYSKHHPSLS